MSIIFGISRSNTLSINHPFWICPFGFINYITLQSRVLSHRSWTHTDLELYLEPKSITVMNFVADFKTGWTLTQIKYSNPIRHEHFIRCRQCEFCGVFSFSYRIRNVKWLVWLLDVSCQKMYLIKSVFNLWCCLLSQVQTNTNRNIVWIPFARLSHCHANKKEIL